MKINGWLNINKPLEMSSAKVVAILKRILGLSKKDKIGHGGTLDPMASGVLPIAIGEATKTVSYVMDGQKGYDFSILFGQESDTGDCEGEIVNVDEDLQSKAIDIGKINKILPDFIGDIEQTPHKYSAIKVDGKRSYELARSGEDFELKSRKVHIYELVCTGGADNIYNFSVKCSKGTYVRSLAIDIAKKMGTFGYVSKLHRTKCANFLIDDAISLDFFEKIGNTSDIERFLIPIKDTLDDISGISVSDQDAVRLRYGQRIKIPNLNGNGEILKAENNNNLIAIVCADVDILRPVRVFNND